MLPSCRTGGSEKGRPLVSLENIFSWLHDLNNSSRLIQWLHLPLAHLEFYQHDPKSSNIHPHGLNLTFSQCTFSTSERQKVVRARQFFTLLHWTCASRNIGVHFFDIATSKSGPRVLCILIWKCASRHNGVQFFISHLAIWLRTRRFSEPTLRPSRATNHVKTTMNRDFPTFSRTCIFFLLPLSLLWSSHCFSSPLWLFPPLLFHLSLLSEVWLLNFLRIAM